MPLPWGQSNFACEVKANACHAVLARMHEYTQVCLQTRVCEHMLCAHVPFEDAIFHQRGTYRIIGSLAVKYFLSFLFFF